MHVSCNGDEAESFIAFVRGSVTISEICSACGKVHPEYDAHIPVEFRVNFDEEVLDLILVKLRKLEHDLNAAVEAAFREIEQKSDEGEAS